MDVIFIVLIYYVIIKKNTIFRSVFIFHENKNMKCSSYLIVCLFDLLSLLQVIYSEKTMNVLGRNSSMIDF